MGAAQNQLVQHFVGAARLDNRYFGLLFALEFVQRFFGQAERFVYRQPDFRLRGGCGCGCDGKRQRAYGE